MTDRDSLEARFLAAMMDTYRLTGEQFGYWPNYFRRMVKDRGGVAAAKKLVHDRKPSPGFMRLVRHKRLDLSAEALVLRPRFAQLFTDEDRTKARERLITYGYEFPAESTVPDRQAT